MNDQDPLLARRRAGLHEFVKGLSGGVDIESVQINIILDGILTLVQTPNDLWMHVFT